MGPMATGAMHPARCGAARPGGAGGTRHRCRLRTAGTATREAAEPATPARLLSWAQLNPEQRRAARQLQYGQYMWDHGLIPMETTACAFGRPWRDLIAQLQNAARVLGWTAESWDAEYRNITRAQNPGPARDARRAARRSGHGPH